MRSGGLSLEMEGKEMRKRIVSSLLLGCALLTGGVSTAYTVHAEDSQTQTGTATIILVNNCDWEDSSGFQFCWMKTMIHMVM